MQYYNIIRQLRNNFVVEISCTMQNFIQDERVEKKFFSQLCETFQGDMKFYTFIEFRNCLLQHYH